jgi:hypothetical protein
LVLILADVASRAKEVGSLIKELILKPHLSYESLEDKAGVRGFVSWRLRRHWSTIFMALRMATSPDDRVILPQYECETHYRDTERIRYLRELRMAREVRLEEVLGLGDASDLRGGRVRRMRDISLPGRSRRP